MPLSLLIHRLGQLALALASQSKVLPCQFAERQQKCLHLLRRNLFNRCPPLRHRQVRRFLQSNLLERRKFRLNKPWPKLNKLNREPTLRSRAQIRLPRPQALDRLRVPFQDREGPLLDQLVLQGLACSPAGIRTRSAMFASLLPPQIQICSSHSPSRTVFRNGRTVKGLLILMLFAW